MIKFFRILLEFIRLILTIGFFAIFGTIWFVLLPFMWIMPWIWVKSGVYGNYDINGIKLFSSNKKFRKLILWQEMKELRKIHLRPFFRFEVLLHSNEVITIDFIEEDLSIILEELELRNIPYIDLD